MISRRTVLKGLSWAGIVAASGVGGALFDAYFINTGEARTPPVLRRENGDGNDFILCDLHAHISTTWDREEVIEALRSPGLVGLAYKPVPAGKRSKILSYPEAVQWIQEAGLERFLTELTPGQLARFGDESRYGYFCNNEEVQGGKYSFILIGVRNYLPNFDTAIDLVNAVHALGAERPTLEFSTPFIINGLTPVSSDDREIIGQIRYLMPRVDLVEILDSCAVDYLPLDGLQTQETNLLTAAVLREVQTENGPWANAGSDAHRDPSVAKMTGHYTVESNLQNMVAYHHALRTGDFFLAGDPESGPYLDRGDFTRTMVLPRITRFLGL